MGLKTAPHDQQLFPQYGVECPKEFNALKVRVSTRENAKDSRLRYARLGLLIALGVGCLPVAVTLATAAGSMPSGEQIARGSDCFSCHAVDHTVVGPAFQAVAKRFAGKQGTMATLIKAIKNGHVGTWGSIAMPSHPNLSHEQMAKAVEWILSMKTVSEQAVPMATNKGYTYTVHGKDLTLSFPVFKPGTGKVTKAVFRGFELYNSYCFRCHGPDGVGGEYAPDLRHVLRNGMTEKQFLDISMAGREAKGMPKWAGFFSPKEILVIYEYVEARSVGLVSVGRPPG